jgi:hypothetical protein
MLLVRTSSFTLGGAIMGAKFAALRESKSVFAAWRMIHISVKLLISTPLFLLALLILLRLLR